MLLDQIGLGRYLVCFACRVLFFSLLIKSFHACTRQLFSCLGFPSKLELLGAFPEITKLLAHGKIGAHVKRDFLIVLGLFQVKGSATHE